MYVGNIEGVKTMFIIYYTVSLCYGIELHCLFLLSLSFRSNLPGLFTAEFSRHLFVAEMLVACISFI